MRTESLSWKDVLCQSHQCKQNRNLGLFLNSLNLILSKKLARDGALWLFLIFKILSRNPTGNGAFEIIDYSRIFGHLLQGGFGSVLLILLQTRTSRQMVFLSCIVFTVSEKTVFRRPGIFCSSYSFAISWIVVKYLPVFWTLLYWKRCWRFAFRLTWQPQEGSPNRTIL